MAPLNLPVEWASASLADINFYASSTVQPKNFPDETFELWSVPVFFAGEPEYLRGDEIGSSKQSVCPNDVLLCKINPRINRVWSVGEIKENRQIASSEWIVVRQPLMNSRYMLRYFQSEQFRVRLCSDVTGVGGSLTRAQPKKVATFPVVVPPLAEQKAIAEKLDTLLAQVESTKARLERIPKILKRFRQSVHAAAVSGKLTEEWRASNSQQPASVLLEAIAKCRASNLQAEIIAGNKESSKLLKKIERHNPQLPDMELPKGWQWTTFMSSMEKVVDCHNKTAPYSDTGIPLIRTPDIRDGRISLTDTRFVDSETYEYWSRRCPPKPGDIIFTREAPMGEAGIIPDGVRLCMGQRMMLIRPLNQHVKADYVLLNILSLSFQQRMVDKAVGTGVKHLRVSDVESLTYPLAPVEEQTEIVRRVDQLFAYADTIETQVNNALERVNNLTQSILAKAFRGELTEQWRKDNPDLISGENSADALLEKIKAERATVGRKRRSRLPTK